MKSEKISKIWARQILDSRGNPTIEVEVTTQNGYFGRAAIPSGASTGSFEAVELRDNNSEYYMGKSVLKAVDNVNKKIAKKLLGFNVFDQKNIDYTMIELDGTANKGKLGANAMLGVSLACAKAGANALKQNLYEYIGGKQACTLPVPMMNIINGGKHADNSINIQEFMIMPIGATCFSQGLEWCTNVFHTLKKVLKSKGYSTAVGDEGGFAPNLKNDEEALKCIVEAISGAGYKPYDQFKIAIDIAATEMYEEAIKIKKQGQYYFWKTKQLFTTEKLIQYYEKLVDKYPIISIEDGLGEEDWAGWKLLNQRLGKKIQLVGDDLFVTNKNRLVKGINEKCANSILIKLNQIGTLTETLETMQMAKNVNFTSIISHRSGETEDTTIADLAVATNAGQIKTGAPSRTDRVCKYNQLLRIEECLGKKAIYLGNNAFFNLK